MCNPRSPLQIDYPKNKFDKASCLYSTYSISVIYMPS